MCAAATRQPWAVGLGLRRIQRPGVLARPPVCATTFCARAPPCVRNDPLSSRAPLCAARCHSGAYHGRPADVWACGVTLCMLVSGRLPFEADNLPGVFAKIKEAPPELPTDVSEPLQRLLSSLLEK
eukprot:5118500-Prymnesium_polylepis.1